MRGEKDFNVGGVDYHLQFYNGYNGHDYVTVYGNGNYMGQMVDVCIGDSNILNHLKKFINENA